MEIPEKCNVVEEPLDLVACTDRARFAPAILPIRTGSKLQASLVALVLLGTERLAAITGIGGNQLIVLRATSPEQECAIRRISRDSWRPSFIEATNRQ